MKATIIPVTPFEQNCTLIWCEETMEAAVVDPGGEIERIMGAVKEVNVNLKQILLTHAHIDHAGEAGALAKQEGLPIIGPHQGDDFWIQQLPKQAEMFGFKNADVFTPDQWLVDGDTIKLGNTVLDVLHCPGHTPGHVVFISKKDRLAIVGDVLFNGSIGRTDFPGGNYDELVASIREKLFPLGDDMVFISGHGPVSTFGQEREHNPFVSDHRG